MTNTSYYDGIAKGYDELHKEEQLKKIAFILCKLKEEIVFDKKEPFVCIDVGCGTGFSLDIFAKETNNSWIGIEPSLGMVKQYKGDQQLLVARAESLPFPDDYADVCISITAIQNFDDISQGIKEMNRVTKSDVPIIISCLKKSPKLGFVAEVLADFLVVKEVFEEEKDIIFVCVNKKQIFCEEENKD